MKNHLFIRILIFTILLCNMTYSEELKHFEKGFYSPSGDRSDQWNKLQLILDKSDHLIYYHENDELWIGITENSDDAEIRPVTFPLSKLRTYFSNQKHKNIIIVKFAINAPTKPLDHAIRELNIFFQDLGYSRVLLLGSGSSGTYVYSDITNTLPVEK